MPTTENLVCLVGGMLILGVPLLIMIWRPEWAAWLRESLSDPPPGDCVPQADGWYATSTPADGITSDTIDFARKDYARDGLMARVYTTGRGRYICYVSVHRRAVGEGDGDTPDDAVSAAAAQIRERGVELLEIAAEIGGERAHWG